MKGRSVWNSTAISVVIKVLRLIVISVIIVVLGLWSCASGWLKYRIGTVTLAWTWSHPMWSQHQLIHVLAVLIWTRKVGMSLGCMKSALVCHHTNWKYITMHMCWCNVCNCTLCVDASMPGVDGVVWTSQNNVPCSCGCISAWFAELNDSFSSVIRPHTGLIDTRCACFCV